MSNELAASAKLAVKGIREGLEAGKEVEALVHDIDKFVTSEAQARATMRQKAQVVRGDTTIVNAVDEWRRLKQIHDLEMQLKNDVITKHGKAEWDKIEKIKERMQKERQSNFDEYERGGSMNWSDILKAVIPIVIASLAWLLGQVSEFSTRLTKIEGSMPALITSGGVPTDSPVSAERRHALKEEIYKDIHELQVKVKLLEEREKIGRN